MHRSLWIVPAVPVESTAAGASTQDRFFRLDLGKIVNSGTNLNSTNVLTG